MSRRPGGRAGAATARAGVMVVVVVAGGLIGATPSLARDSARVAPTSTALATTGLGPTPTDGVGLHTDRPVAATVLSGGATPVPAPAAADDPARVTLLEVSPVVITATGALTLAGTVANTSGEDLTRLNAYLRMSRTPATDRAGVARLAAPEFRTAFRPGPFVPLGDVLVAGASTTFRLEVPVADLGLTEPGVYPIGIEILASFEDGTRGTAGSATTLVPWLPGADPGSTVSAYSVPVAIAIPLTAPVDRAPDGAYTSESLGELLAPGGQLGALAVEPASRRETVSWLVDPAMVEAAVDLADGYDVRSGAAPAVAVPGVHSADARAWLAWVVSRVDAGAVTLLPYANVDLVALVRGGLQDDAAAAIAVAAARAAGALAAGRALLLDAGPFPTATEDMPVDINPNDAYPAATTGLANTGPGPTPGTTDPANIEAGETADGPETSLDLVYPPSGELDAATAGVLAAAGVRTVLLAAPGDAGSTDATPSAPAPRLLTGPGGAAPSIAALTVDPLLSDIVAGSLDALAARQLSLAYTAVAALDRGTSSIGTPLVVVVPPDPPEPSAAAALDVLTGAVPWVDPVALDAVLTQAPAGQLAVSYPLAAEAAELPPAYVRSLAQLRGSTATATSLDGNVEGADDLQLARLRAASAGWRGEPERAEHQVAELAAQVSARLDAVRIVTTGTVTLSSDSGRFPLTVANDLDQPVTVRLALAPRAPARLQTSGAEVIEIAAGKKTTVDVSAKATTNGVYLVDARLETADGEPFGAITPITLRATQYDTVAWVVMGAASALLVVGSGVRLVRRFRGRHDEAAA